MFQLSITVDRLDGVLRCPASNCCTKSEMQICYGFQENSFKVKNKQLCCSCYSCKYMPCFQFESHRKFNKEFNKELLN